MTRHDRLPLWADILNPSDAHVIAALVRGLGDVPFTLTARQRAETVDLSRMYGLPVRIVGRDRPGPVAKVVDYGLRVLQLQLAVPAFAASLSFNNMNAVVVAKARRRPSMVLMDNDLDFEAVRWSRAKRLEVSANLRATHLYVPTVFPLQRMLELGAQESSIHTYDGYKEDLYLAHFRPDPDFPRRLPFSNYVVLRPEARSAFYVRESSTLVPQIARLLSDAGQAVVYLPRDEGDPVLAESDYPNVYVPPAPLDGVQLAWHARAVLTGSGTFAREAACMGVPAASFFPERLLAVDAKLVREGRMVHSRDPRQIAAHAMSAHARGKRDLRRSKAIFDAVLRSMREHIMSMRAAH
jgi:uncharacterized protein